MVDPSFATAIILGALLAVPYALYARSNRRPGFVFGLGLAVTALVYVVFAAAGGAGPRALLVEAAGVALFGAAAALGTLKHPQLLAAGWAGHVGWDLLLHSVDASGYAPWWYPLLSVGFDLFVAGVVFAVGPNRQSPPPG